MRFEDKPDGGFTVSTLIPPEVEALEGRLEVVRDDANGLVYRLHKAVAVAAE
jgi:hypothetical protein